MSLARQIVDFAIKAGSSDIHLEEGSPIAIRVNSDIKILSNTLSSQAMDQLLSELLSDEKNQQSLRRRYQIRDATVSILSRGSRMVADAR